MENFKIKVENNIDELVSLFGQLGCKYFNHTGSQRNYMFFEDGRVYFCKLKSNFNASKCKLVTISELRDLVVLKRNNVGDSNYKLFISPSQGYLNLYRDSSDVFYSYATKSKTWDKSKSVSIKTKNLKPIEKPMKEYLIPNDGNYKYQKTFAFTAWKKWIEIPEGADICANHENGKLYFWKNDGVTHWVGELNKFSGNNQKYTTLKEFLNEWPNSKVVWSRHTQPEELPFVDDEPSLNDQYADIEKVRQSDKVLKEILEGDLPEFNFMPSSSAWDNQVGGDHYKQMVIQPMEFALKNKLDYAQANVVKYVTRHAHKNGKQDLLKAIHNIELMIEHYYGE